MTSLLLSRRDLDFQLYEWLDAESLNRYPAYAGHDHETFGAVLDTCERMATDLFATHNKKNDRIEPLFEGLKVHLNSEVSGGSQSFNAVNQMRILGRWMRMLTIPNQSSVAGDALHSSRRARRGFCGMSHKAQNPRQG